MNTICEEWRTHPALGDKYQVSNLGRIRSLCFKKVDCPIILKANCTRGYYIILIRQKSYTIHSLVAACFIGPRNGMHINHINGVKKDNRAENLEYCTPSENMKHCFRLGLQSNKGEKHSRAKLTDENVRNIHSMYRLEALSQADIARMFGVTRTVICGIVRGRTWKHINH